MIEETVWKDQETTQRDCLQALRLSLFLYRRHARLYRERDPICINEILVINFTNSTPEVIQYHDDGTSPEFQRFSTVRW